MGGTQEPRDEAAGPTSDPSEVELVEVGTDEVVVSGGFADFTPEQRRRLLLGTIARITVVTGCVLLVYFVLPLERETTGAGLVLLVGGVVGLGASVVHQVRRILSSPTPQLRAIQSLATFVPLFVVVFSLVYVVMSAADPSSFSQPISRVTGLYFTVTVLATVGFGDVTAVTDGARLVVTLQMLLDILLVGILAKVIVGASRIGVERRRAEAAQRAAPAAPTSEG